MELSRFDSLKGATYSRSFRYSERAARTTSDQPLSGTPKLLAMVARATISKHPQRLRSATMASYDPSTPGYAPTAALIEHALMRHWRVVGFMPYGRT